MLILAPGRRRFVSAGGGFGGLKPNLSVVSWFFDAGNNSAGSGSE